MSLRENIFITKMSLNKNRCREHCFISNGSNESSFKGSTIRKTETLTAADSYGGVSSSVSSTPASTPSSHSVSSKVSSSYLSDASCATTFSVWSTDFQQRQRSPYSKNILTDIKEKLLEEVKNVELEINIIEIEKATLLNIRMFVINFRALLNESDRN